MSSEGVFTQKVRVLQFDIKTYRGGPLNIFYEKLINVYFPAFNTSTGMPYGTVNLRHGVPKDETPITCTAGVATFIVEFGALTRLTGDPIFEQTALRAMRSLWQTRSSIGLVRSASPFIRDLLIFLVFYIVACQGSGSPSKTATRAWTRDTHCPLAR